MHKISNQCSMLYPGWIRKQRTPNIKTVMSYMYNDQQKLDLSKLRIVSLFWLCIRAFIHQNVTSNIYLSNLMLYVFIHALVYKNKVLEINITVKKLLERIYLSKLRIVSQFWLCVRESTHQNITSNKYLSNILMS